MRAVPLLLVGLAFVAAACQGTARGRRTFRDDAVRDDGAPPRTSAAAPTPPPPPRPDPGRIEGTPSIRVIWEALYVEREQVLNPRTGRAGLQGIAGAPDLEVAILNSSFDGTPEQIADNRARRKQGGLTKVDDQDMLDFLKSIRKAGFYEYARPTRAIEGLFSSERSRGRITIEQDGESVTLLSQRGLGLSEDTKEIPGIYSEAKRAIQVLRNRSRTLEVTGARVTGHAPTAPPVEPPPTKKPKK